METRIYPHNKLAAVFFLLRSGKFPPIRQHDFYDLLGHLADFRKHRSPVTSMHSAVGKRGNPANVAGILIAPVDDFCVTIRNLFDIFFRGFSSKGFAIRDLISTRP